MNFKKKKIILTGVGDTCNNGCWVMVNTLIESINSFSDVPVEFVYLMFGKNSDESRLNRENLSFISVPWNVLKIPKIKRLVMEVCFLLIPLLAFFKKMSNGNLYFGKFIEEIYSADLVIDLSGDSYSIDYGDLSLKLLLIPLMTARLINIPYMFCAQSIGMFGNNFRFKILKNLLKDAALITVREKITQDYLAEHGIAKNVELTSDLAFIQTPCDEDRIRDIVLREKIDINYKLVGISASDLVSKYLVTDSSDNEKSIRLIELIANLSDYLVEAYDYKILFVPHVTIAGRNDDRIILNKIKEKMKNSSKGFIIKDVYNGAELKGLIKFCDFFIGTRMHATLGALSQHIPTITYVYNHKTIGINGEMLGQEKYLIDLRNTPAKDLLNESKQKIDHLIENKTEIRKKLIKVIKVVKNESLKNAKYALDLLGISEPLLNMKDIEDCTGCGTCAGVCPIGVLKMKINHEGVYRPTLSGKCTRCGICTDVCPIQGMDLRKYEKEMFSGASIETELGAVESCFVGHSKDKNIRYKSSSGGLITSVNRYLLKNKIVDAILVVGDDPQKPIQPKAFWAETVEDLKKQTTSKYIPVTLNEAFNKIPQNAKRLSVVGLPCHLWGISLMEQKGLLKGKKIDFKISLFCAKTASMNSMEFLLRKMKIKENDINRVQFRGDGWPGHFKIDKKEVLSIPLGDIWPQLWGSPYFTPKHCNCCPDFFGCLSDISVGDAWGLKKTGIDDGWSLCLARNKNGNDILKKINEEGELHIENIPMHDVMEVAKDYIHKKMHKTEIKEKVYGAKYPIQYKCNNQIMKRHCIIYGKIIKNMSVYGKSTILSDKFLSYPPNLLMKLTNKILTVFN